ncbi:MAG: peptide chain release factor N(5)-glutamine methyltransferase [Planctomycetes bacterium]|nr:peptide chain release factor N(5)-glutamine methyltransferase [Planctomycetota bacterium]
MSAELATPTSPAAEWSIARLLAWTTEYLTRQGIDDARLSTEVLLAHALGCRRIELYTRGDVVPPPEPLNRFRDWVRRAAAREPIAYLVGEKEFFSLPFAVTRDVLIPRPETELLVECVLDHCRSAGLASPTLLDLGTGSGCLAIAVLVHLKHARAIASDRSPAALLVARQNAERHGVAERLTLLEADGLTLPEGVIPPAGVDVLMSNPPYIAASAVAGLDPEVRDYEPRAALTDEADGLSFYRMIATAGARCLAAGGVVVVEVADGQAAAVHAILEGTGGAGEFVHRRTIRDRTVGSERVLMFGARG